MFSNVPLRPEAVEPTEVEPQGSATSAQLQGASSEEMPTRSEQSGARPKAESSGIKSSLHEVQKLMQRQQVVRKVASRFKRDTEAVKQSRVCAIQ